MIERDGTEYYVLVDGVRIKGPFDSLGEAVRADNKVKYHMMASDNPTCYILKEIAKALRGEE